MSKNWKNLLIICIVLNFTYLFSANSDISLHMNKNLSIQQSESLKKVDDMKEMFITNKAKYSETLLDSVVYFGNGEKNIRNFTYDENGNSIVEVYIKKDETGTTLYSSWKNEKTYNDNGVLLERLSKELVEGVWINYSIEISSYDENGFPTMMLQQGWDSENEVWVNDEKVVVTIDGFNFTMIAEEWDSDAELWVGIARMTITASEQINISDIDEWENNDSELVEFWDEDTGDWKVFSRTNYTYDDNGNLIEEIRQGWSDDTSEWIDYELNVYTFDENEKLISYRYKAYSPWTMDWYLNVRYTNYYDGSGNIVEKIDDEWDYGTETWENSFREVYTFDGSNNMLTKIVQSWDEDVEPQAWKDVDKDIYTYNNNNKPLTRLKQNKYWGATEWQDDTRDAYEYASNGYLNHYTNELYQSDGVWVPWSGDVYLELMEFDVSYCRELYAYYNDAATSIEEKEIFINNYSISQNFPNPFNPQTIINYSIPNNDKVKISVYNTLGQKVAVLVNKQQSAGSYNVQFDGSNFASGIYYYQITAGNFHQTNQMLLIK